VTTIVGTVQEIVRHELRNVRISEVGLVEAVYPHSDSADDDNYGCDVRLRTGLILKRVPVATSHIGSAAIPNVGDLVLLAFDRGDVNAPIVIARLYNDVDRAPLNHPDEVIFRLPLADSDEKTIKGALRRVDGDPSRELLFELPPKITVRVTDGTVRATAGKTELTLDQPDGGGGTVTVVTGRTKIVLNQDGDVTVEAAQAMTLRATGSLSLEGTDVSIKGTAGDVTVQAVGSATVKGGASTTVQAGASVTVQGGLVDVKGVTSFSL
jgi:phage baseplate assembly protein gpV